MIHLPPQHLTTSYSYDPNHRFVGIRESALVYYDHPPLADAKPDTEIIWLALFIRAGSKTPGSVMNPVNAAGANGSFGAVILFWVRRRYWHHTHNLSYTMRLGLFRKWYNQYGQRGIIKKCPAF